MPETTVRCRLPNSSSDLISLRNMVMALSLALLLAACGGEAPTPTAAPLPTPTVTLPATATRATPADLDATLPLLAVIDFAADGQPTQVYQDPTWDDAGWLGYVTLDRNGNLFVFPAPRENLVDNSPEKANILYRVDSTSAQMTSVITLTAPAPPSPENPYGLLGTTLDCDTDSLYVTTVAGSNACQ